MVRSEQDIEVAEEDIFSSLIAFENGKQMGKKWLFIPRVCCFAPLSGKLLFLINHLFLFFNPLILPFHYKYYYKIKYRSSNILVSPVPQFFLLVECPSVLEKRKKYFSFRGRGLVGFQSLYLIALLSIFAQLLKIPKLTICEVGSLASHRIIFQWTIFR